MKIYTELTQKVTVITKNATPYDVDGKQGYHIPPCCHER